MPHINAWALFLGSLAVGLAPATYAAKTATMKLPDQVSVVLERHPATGFGGKNRGRYEIDDHGGEFTRIESRLSIFDPLYVTNRGRGAFTLSRSGSDEILSAECEPKQRVVTVGIFTFDPKRLAYSCEIASNVDGRIGSLALGQPRPDDFRARVLAQSVRRGELVLGETRLEIESIHQHEGARFQVQYPVGYLFSFDGRTIGGIELTNVNPTVLIEEGLAGDLRQAVFVAALALSVFRDPADSALGD
jgi:hypothetical protein